MKRRSRLDKGTEAEMRRTHAAYDLIVVRKMSFAAFAAINLAAIQVDVVCQTHDCDNDKAGSR